MKTVFFGDATWEMVLVWEIFWHAEGFGGGEPQMSPVSGNNESQGRGEAAGS